MSQTNQTPIVTTVQSDADVRGILSLQQKNLKKNLSSDEIASQGFVTVEHEYSVLKAMNDAQASVIAKDGEEVVAYCLAMLPEFRNDVKELKVLFDEIDQINYQNKLLKDYKYVVMGQVCVGKGFRSIGLFDKMYQKLKEELADRFELCVTDISMNNPRSLKAHGRVGFIPIKDFADQQLNETWRIVLWDWQK